ncbi:SNARE associated Golgi protein [uncultured archaeon]|nr:SNARE associated Golgi protein [uncultured archaeon]
MITELLLGTFLAIIQALGYLGVFVLMVAESTFLPVPSEAVLPFAGYLVALGQMDFWIVLLISTIGTIIGSLISYYIGKILGEKFFERVGKKFFIKKEEIRLAEKWFERHGQKTIFLCRFIPVVRHVISVPAGIAKMPRRKFVLYTAIGGAMWNAFLIGVGMQLQQNWNAILAYTQVLDVLIIIVLIGVIAWLAYKRMRNKK